MIDTIHQGYTQYDYCNSRNRHNTCNICNICNICKNNKYVNPFEIENTTETYETYESYEYIVSSFLRNYYDTIATNGWNHVQDMFHHDCVVVFKGVNVGNSYDMLTILARENIKNAIYSDIHINWVTLPNATFMTEQKSVVITVSCNVQFITYTNIYYNPIRMIETFIISPSSNSVYKCSRQIIDF